MDILRHDLLDVGLGGGFPPGTLEANPKQSIFYWSDNCDFDEFKILLK